MLPWIQRVGIVATLLSTGVITPIAPALAQSTSTLPEVGRAPGLLRKISNLRAQPALGIPVGNVQMSVGPNGETAAQTFSIPRGSTRTSIGFGGAHANIIKPAVEEISCTIQINYPHDSGHNPGNINVTGSITCTAPVTVLDIGVGLYLDEYLLASNYKVGTGAYISTNAATPCLLPGVYQGGVVGAVTFPPGFVPPWSDWGGTEFLSPGFYFDC